MKTHCELCKCLNLIAEGKKHPSQTVWFALNRKFGAIVSKDRNALSTFCDNHRIPLRLTTNLYSVNDFINEVLNEVEKYLMKSSKGNL